MQITVFASGSSGNCLLVSSGDSNLLIDAGISMRRISAGLTQAGISWQDIGGVLITHEHSDHICGLKTMIRQRSVPIYAPRTVANRLYGMLPGIENCLRFTPVGESFPLAGFQVRAFHTPHDTDESVGYRVEADGVFALARAACRRVRVETQASYARLSSVKSAINSSASQRLMRSLPVVCL